MLIVESLENKQTLIQITLDEIQVALSNHGNRCFLLDFLNVCKKQLSEHIQAIFIGNTKNPHMDIQNPQYIEFAKQIQQKIITIAASKRVNILKNSCFCILLNDNSEYIKPITKNEYENQLNLFKTSLTNDLIEIFKPADFGIKFEQILINILDNKSEYIIKQNQFKSKLSKDNQLLEHDSYSLLTNKPAHNPIIRYFDSYFKSKKRWRLCKFITTI